MYCPNSAYDIYIRIIRQRLSADKRYLHQLGNENITSHCRENSVTVANRMENIDERLKSKREKWDSGSYYNDTVQTYKNCKKQ